MRFRPLLLTSFLVLALLIPTPAQAQKSPGSPGKNVSFLAAFQQVAKQPSQSTVVIRCNNQTVALGTIVDSAGLILTRASDLTGDVLVRLPDGKELEATIQAVHEEHDLALLKVEATDLTPIRWRPSKEAPVGYWALSVGPKSELVALGVVSVGMRNLPKGRPGVSGGPRAGSAYLGISFDPAAPLPRIAQVLPSSGASKAGLRVDDVILKIADKVIMAPEEVRAALSKYRPGQTVALKVKRGDDELELKATLGKAPVNRGELQNSMGSELSKRRDGFPTVLQHDSIIKPSECGGPLVDLEGKCIGINIARAGRTESYAIPTEVIRPLLEEMKAGKHAPKKR